MKEKRRYEFRGELLTAGEIAAKTKLSQQVISSRLHAGKRGEALAEPLMSRSESARKANATAEMNRKKQKEAMTRAEVARDLRITKSAVGKIERKAMEKARKKINRMGIRKEDVI